MSRHDTSDLPLVSFNGNGDLTDEEDQPEEQPEEDTLERDKDGYRPISDPADLAGVRAGPTTVLPKPLAVPARPAMAPLELAAQIPPIVQTPQVSSLRTVSLRAPVQTSRLGC